MVSIGVFVVLGTPWAQVGATGKVGPFLSELSKSPLFAAPGVDGDHGLDRLTFAVDEVFADLEALVGSAHHPDLLGGVEGQIVVDPVLPGMLAFLGDLNKVPILNQSGTYNLILNPV